jgi:class 3 adenylate cyclase
VDATRRESPPRDENALAELRLFLEELCCNLLRFQHAQEDGVDPERVRIRQEVYLGRPGAFADIRVAPPGERPYFVEIKFGYPPDRLVSHLGRKYGPDAPAGAEADKLVLVVEREEDVEPRLREALHPGLTLEVWDEPRLLSLLHERFGVEADRISPDEVTDLRLSIDRAKGAYAFGAEYNGEPHQTALLWHFGFWRLEQLSEGGAVPSREIMAPGVYRGVAVLYADLSSFSSYVRDTREDTVVRHALTSFYSKARYQVLNSGGMLYQFLGDGVLALFGVPEPQEDYEARALECAAALLEIGASVSNEWQRHIDHVQESAGCHVALALGDLNVLSVRPFSRTYMGAIGEAINLASRLTGAAAAGEIVVSNGFFQRLADPLQEGFEELAAVEAKNIGRIHAWKLGSEEARRALAAL